ncbi:oxysterol-binding protein-related protein 3-like [Polypterus senegalus]|uniref:oxysterol-binding protein-related protein 3-like n=1 Tax=Polypterus senegalus TaxID=55291 RepID=UPI001964578B|nr:oxysterol-binding protein-related protein 3-like [Polypterus senegalus]XP_039592330.1 oxysterol-binding protein-related protein 3-like [Polypterus senegalus]XP_039592331.1 oxysterol-binding protein-related protein 3-like [Polypterus senegalus]
MNSDDKNATVSPSVPSPSRSISSSSSKQGSRQDSWEIVEGLRGNGSNIQEPQKQEGFMLKKRKWPLKGWHKRYFFLDRGILKYAKSEADIEKGKLHGCIDVGLSVMAVKKKAKCIDLDTEDHLYHLKVKSQELFDEWVSKLRHHRLYRQNEISMFPVDKSNHFSPHFPPAPSPNPSESSSMRKRSILTRQTSINNGGAFPVSSSSSQAKVAAWLQSSEDMDKCAKELSLCQTYLLELSQLLQNMEVLHRTYSAPAINALQAATFESPKKEKRSQRRWRAKNYGKDGKTTLQVPSCISSGSIRLHASNPNLSTVEHGNDKSYSESPDSPTDASKLHEEFCHVANNLYSAFKSAFSLMRTEKEKLKQMFDYEVCQSPSAQIIGMKNTLTSKQDTSDATKSLVHQLSTESRASVSESLSEFFDAQEVLLSASSSENEASEDESYISDVSDNISVDCLSSEIETPSTVHNGAILEYRRRSCLPSPSPNTSNISLWNILRNNIGKDLSKVAMPVQLNEPLNTLQHLCEELEYSELLDKAAETPDPFERMIYIATFAISGYASSYYRAGSKPFNPVLGETYECERKDKGFRFIAEQVSHHPPISACHAESKHFVFWQDIRWKNKFWGKSMEIVPVGTTHVTLPDSGDHYEWNKVTSCIHNILSGQRWIEHYGEIAIKNTNNNCQCKVTFVKAKYWNSSVNEIEGTVTDCNGKAVHQLFGKWHESIYCGVPPSSKCIWRANPMPRDFEQYYGFTKFALELNEMDAAMKLLLPPTDTRYRIDQRLLEEGNTDAAEVQKQRIEQLQRDRRKVLEENSMMHQPKFFRKSSEDTWVSNGTYWNLRKDPGFAKLDNPVLW